MALKRSLTLGILILIGINTLIGSGIFFDSAIAAKIAGPYAIFAWIITAILSIIISSFFAELSEMFPNSGGVYIYAKKAFGEIIGFCVGWSSWLISNIYIAMFLTGSLQFISILFPLSSLTKLIIASIFILFMNFISFKGIEASTKFLIFFAIATISTLLMIIFVGAPHINFSNLNSFDLYPKTGIILAIFFVLETFAGWESLSFLSEETKDAKKTLPKVMLFSTLIVSILVIATIFISMTAMPWYLTAYSKVNSISDFKEKLNSGNLDEQKISLIHITSYFAGENFQKILIIIAFLNIIGSASMLIVSTPRLIYAMARDKVLPEGLSRLHPKNKTPYNAIIFQTIISLFVILSNSYEFLLKIATPLSIFMYGTVILAVPKLRKNPSLKEHNFKVPFPHLTSFLVLSILTISMLLTFAIKEIIIALLFISLGVILYFIARLGYNKKFIRFFSEISAKLNYITYDFLVKRKIMPHLNNFLSDITISKVVDLGCGIGVITNALAEECIPLDGKIYGLDFSRNSLKIAHQIAKERNIPNVKFIEIDLYQIKNQKKINEELQNLDAVIGIGILEYLHNPVKILKDFKERLRKGGKFYFVDYDFAFHLIDKPWIEENKKIYQLFEKAGLKPKIWRQKGLFWQYVHIYGEKDE